MFGIDGIEFLIILIVMVVVVGPKDLPKMMRAFGQATARMRRTATEFRRHFDEAMREAELDDIADTVSQAKKLDPRKKLTEIFDPIRDVTHDIQNSLREQVGGNVPQERGEKGTDAKPAQILSEKVAVEKVAIEPKKAEAKKVTTRQRKAPAGSSKAPTQLGKVAKSAKTTRTTKSVKTTKPAKPTKTIQPSGDSSN